MSSEIPASARRTEGRKPGRFAIAISVLALLATVYAVIRIDVLRDRITTVRNGVQDVQSSLSVVRAEQDKQSSTLETTSTKLAAIDEMQKELSALAAAVDELRGRADKPQRTWARAEALYLLQLAERQLQFARDVRTAMAAIEAADNRLGELRDPTLAAVRAQIAKDLQALRSVPDPDRGGILVRLNRAETLVPQLKLAGIVLDDVQVPANDLPERGLKRAWIVLKNTFARLFTVRNISGSAAQLVSTDEQVLRRQHLQLLLSSARQALINGDEPAYESALNAAARWTAQGFDDSDETVRALADEIAALAKIKIAPPLPSITESVRLLQRFVAGSPGS